MSRIIIWMAPWSTQNNEFWTNNKKQKLFFPYVTNWISFFVQFNIFCWFFFTFCIFHSEILPVHIELLFRPSPSPSSFKKISFSFEALDQTQTSRWGRWNNQGSLFFENTQWIEFGFYFATKLPFKVCTFWGKLA